MAPKEQSSEPYGVSGEEVAPRGKISLGGYLKETGDLKKKKKVPLCLHLAVNLEPALSPKYAEETPHSLFQTRPVEHILAFCYHFSLQKLPFMFIFNALLFDENIVGERGGVISLSP